MKVKPLILVFPFNLLSHYLRCLQLANDLRDHFEIYFAYSREYENWFSDYPSFHCETFDPQEVMACSKRFEFSWLNSENIERVFISQVKVINQYRPALVMGDAAFTLKIAAEKCNVKYVSVINGYMSKYYKLTRKLSRTHKAYNYLNQLPTGVANVVTRVAEQVAFKKVHKSFRALRRKYLLSQKKYYLDELEGDHTFICDVPELFPQKQLPSSYQFIGPVFYESDQVEEEILQRIDKNKLTLLISLGSSGDWEKFSFLNDPLFHEFNIITSGDKDAVIQGRHVIGKPFLNNISLLPFADAMICHGGNGTIYQALSCNIPVLGITSHFEQEWNMDRIQELKLGVSIHDITSSTELKKAISEGIKQKPGIDFKKFMTPFTSQLRKKILYSAVMSHADADLQSAYPEPGKF